MENCSKTPDHVSKQNLWDGDLAAFLMELDDPYLAGGRLHEGPDILWVTNASSGVPSWVFTRHALIRKAFSNARLFSSKRGPVTNAIMNPDWLMLPVEADAPEHMQYRRLLQPFFTPEAMAKRFVEVQSLTDSLMEAFIDRGRCEFIEEFAAILPNAIVISMLGMPSDMLPQFVAWEKVLIHGKDAERQLAAATSIHEYIRSFMAEQKRNTTNELMRGIFAARIDGRPITEAEQLGIVYLLFVAGLDTVYSTLGWVMNYLACDHALQDRLRQHPGDINDAVEEFTRAFGVSSPSRIVAEDMVFEGVMMKKGDQVLLPTYLSGRDPRAFENPHAIDIDRHKVHNTFGTGPHVCLGINLAKREIRVVIESFLSRMNNIRRPADGRFAYHTAGTIGIDCLDLEWDPV